MKIKSLIQKLILSFIKPCLIFESYPDFADNTKYVFDEFVKRDYYKKYYLYWFIDYDKAASYHNGEIEYWNPKDKRSIKKYIRHLRYYKKVKAYILCNRYVLPEKNNDYSTTFYLTHGMPLKNISGYYRVPDRIDYCISPSEETRAVMEYCFGYDYDKIVPLGFPRNDVFIEREIDVKTQFENINKIIIWYPTYKQHKFGMKTNCEHPIPIIHNKESIQRINKLLFDNKILIIIKPHFSQDLSFIKREKLSNIMFIDDSFFQKFNILPYQFLHSCDALLTDYSSVYSDYLLSNKPIGLIWEDIDDYLKYPGLYPKYDDITFGTHKIYSIDDMIDFIKMIAEGKDSLESERNRLRDKLNISTDGQNTKRVVDFIVEKAKL